VTESGVFAVFRDTDRLFYRQLFDAVFSTVPADLGIVVCRGPAAVHVCSGTASEVTLHVPAYDGDTLLSALLPLLPSTTQQRNCALPERRALLELLPQSLRQRLDAAHSSFGMVLHAEWGPCGLAVFLRHAESPPFSETDVPKFRAFEPLVALSVAEHLRRTELAGQSTDDANLQLDSCAEKLGRQERKIATLIANGYAVVNIAGITNLTEHTVRTYIRRIYKKLGVCNRAELVRCLLTGDRLAS